MINYYALWIPFCKEEVPNIQREGLDEVVLQDIPESDSIRLKGTIDESFDIHLQYQINAGEWNSLCFTYIDKQSDGFIFYSLEMEDGELGKDIVCKRLSKSLPKSIYHYFKEFFHTHSLHATGEDSLLPVYHSDVPIDWKDSQIKSAVVTPIIEAYVDKFNGYYLRGKEDLQRCTTAICQNKEVTKNIHNLRHFLHEGYNVKREMDYCNFLLDRHQAVIGDETCMKIQQAYQDFLTYYTDLDFWYHAYLDTISFSDSKVSKRWGITGGILGLLSIAITLFLEYRPSKSESLDTQLLKSDSLMQVRQDSLIRKVDLLINSSQSDILNHNTPSKDPAIRQ